MQKPVQAAITDYYNQLAPEYDTDRFGNTYGRFLHRQEAFFMRKLVTANAAPVLSLGCGTGRLMEMATHGADISPAMIAEAKKKYPGKQFTVCSAAQTAYENGYFSGTFSLHVLMHLPLETIEAILAEAHRITAPGGWLIVDFPNASRRKLTRSNKPGWHAGTSFTTAAFAQLAGKYGWSIEKQYGILLFPVHRLSVAMRNLFFWADTLLCRLFTKRYASYILVKLCKKQ
jgi:ubiquinone/menaquinone biosynthesis C-methylase UbiE